MRGWAFTLELGSKSQRCWRIGVGAGGEYHVWWLGNTDWSDPLKPVWDPPSPTVNTRRLEFNSINADVDIDLQWLKALDPDGQEVWPLINAWNFKFSNPFIGYPTMTYLGKEVQLKEYQGRHLNMIDLPNYAGQNFPADFYWYRDADSSGYKEITLRID
jgi:hypothetical protein